MIVGSSAVHKVVPPPPAGGVTTGGVTTGGVTTGGVTIGVVGATPPLLAVAMAVTAAFDSGLVSVGSGLKAVESAVKPAVCELVATLAKITAAKFLPASVNVAAVAGNEPLLALASAAMSLMLCSNVLPVGTA